MPRLMMRCRSAEVQTVEGACFNVDRERMDVQIHP